MCFLEQLHNISFGLLQPVFKGLISYSFFSRTQICYKIFQLLQPLSLLCHLRERDRAQLRCRAKHLETLCFQQASASHGRKSCCTSGHVPPSPVVPTVASVALPYLSLICNRLDTLGSLAMSGCRNSSLHTGHSGSPRSLPYTHSDRSPGTAGSANPRDHSRRLWGS